MGKVVVSQFITVDGVIEDPGGSENFERGGWAFEFNRGEDGDKFKLDEVMSAAALLLGRTTYEGFAAAWPEAEAIHGLTPVDVQDAPTLEALRPQIVQAVSGKTVVIYNAAFDQGFLPAELAQAPELRC